MIKQDIYVRAEDLVLCAQTHEVECFGGPNDGEFRPANENGMRPNGVYVVAVDERENVIIAKVYWPR